MIFTTYQIKEGVGVGWNSLKVDKLALKDEVPTIAEFNRLDEALGQKLDKTPMHTHYASEVKDLQEQLDTKLDNKQYSYQNIISNIINHKMTPIH